MVLITIVFLGLLLTNVHITIWQRMDDHSKFREVLFICPICVYGPILLAGGVNMRLRCIKKNKSCAMNAYWGI